MKANVSKSRKYTLTPDEFIKALQGKEVEDIQGEKFSFLVDDENPINVKISNVIVEEEIIISNEFTFLYSIRIENCEINSDLTFYGGTFEKGFQIQSGKFNGSINFISGKFLWGFRIFGGVFHNVGIVDCEFQHNFLIKGGEFSIFIIKGGTFQKKFIIAEGKFNNEFEISGGVFNSNFQIQNGEFLDKFKFLGGDFFAEFVIRNGKFNKGLDISINNIVKFNDVFEIYGGEFEYLDISGGTFNKSLNIYGGIYNDGIDIKWCSIENGIYITNGVIHKKLSIFQTKKLGAIILQGKNVFINNFLINTNITFNINIDGIYINGLLFNNHLNNGCFIYLKNLTLSKILFDKFNNEGKISITDIKSKERLENEEIFYDYPIKIIRDFDMWVKDKSEFCIEDCDIGNTTFFNVDFLSFDKIKIWNSRLSEIRTINKHIPIYSEKEIISSENGETNFQSLEETYNQLYLAMQKQGNRTKEIDYYKEYLDWHRRYKFNRLKGRFFNKLCKQDWYSTFSLWVHKKSSSYGTNWVRSFLFLLGFGLLFYCCYLWLLGYRYLDFSNLGYNFRYYVEFLLPTHKFNFIPDTNPIGWATLFDILNRIFVGFLLYQTIAAFRRFGMK